MGAWRDPSPSCASLTLKELLHQPWVVEIPELGDLGMNYGEFRDDLLIALGRASQRTKRNYLTPRSIAHAAGLEYMVGWVGDAIRELEAKGFVKGSYTLDSSIDEGIEAVVTGAGWDEAQRLFRTREFAEEEFAPDRYVAIDHSSSNFKVAEAALMKALEAVRGNNVYADAEPEDHEQRVAELESGHRLLKAVRVRVEPIKILLGKALRWLAEKFAESAVGIVAAAALAALAALFGFPIG